MSMLTTSESFGLWPMVGLIKRYRVARVAPPEVLYVDRDCCGNTLRRRMFEEWDQMTLTYGTSCGGLLLVAPLTHIIGMQPSRAALVNVFLCGDDLTTLKKAKLADLQHGNLLCYISRSELALHCKRTMCRTSKTQP